MIGIISFILWLLNKVIDLYILAILAFALMSWFPGAYNTQIGRFLGKIVYPFENLFSFATVGSVSFSPIIAVLVLSVAQNFINYLGNMLIGY